jgi:hypothetical protein
MTQKSQRAQLMRHYHKQLLPSQNMTSKEMNAAGLLDRPAKILWDLIKKWPQGRPDDKLFRRLVKSAKRQNLNIEALCIKVLILLTILVYLWYEGNKICNNLYLMPTKELNVSTYEEQAPISYGMFTL